MMEFLRKYILNLSLGCILFLIGLNALLIYQNRQIIDANTIVLQELVEMEKRGQLILTETVHGLDLGVRGYFAYRDTAMLVPYRKAIARNQEIFANLDSLATKYQVNPELLDQTKAEVEEYIRFVQEMKTLVDLDSNRQFIALLKQDRGNLVWRKYNVLTAELNNKATELRNTARLEYQTAMSRNIYLQIILFCISLPILVGVILRISKSQQQRNAFLAQLDENTKRYLFDNGGQSQKNDANTVFESLTANLQNATAFISQIAQNNLNTNWHGLNEQNKSSNINNLAGQLVHMRDQLIAIDGKELERTWATKGQAMFGDLLSKEDDNLDRLTYAVISQLTKYLGANQGAFFVVDQEATEQVKLVLRGCYAYDQQKLLTKEVLPGEGLIGQVFLEKATVYIDDLPADYSHIASGLGQASPKCLLIVPLKFNNEVYGVLEIASFGGFQPYQVEFVEGIAGNITATVAGAKNTERTQRLLLESQTMTEQLRAQEEEMRQNMEELIATQEEMERKQAELEVNQKKLQSNEGIMKKAYEKLKEQEKEAKTKQQEYLQLNEEMRAQEEEMRQNMEMLVATQEEMELKQAKLEANQEQLQINEAIMKEAYEKLEEQEKEAKSKQQEYLQLNEEMRAQEEEMRQNMEMLVATQEEMELKQVKLEAYQEQLRINEAIMKDAYENLEEQEKEAQTKKQEYFQLNEKLRIKEVEMRQNMEEEMQQNMEEHHATQEEMARKQAELEAQQEKLQSNEAIMKEAYEKLKEQEKEAKTKQQEYFQFNEELRAQEESMRYNMEDLVTAQEEVANQQIELERERQQAAKRQEDLEANEQVLKKAFERTSEVQAHSVEEIERLRRELAEKEQRITELQKANDRA